MLRGVAFLMTGLILLLGVTTFCLAQTTNNAEQLTITTYYPSPYGVYKNLRLFPYEVNPGDKCDQPGNMAYSQGSHAVLYCNDTDPNDIVWMLVSDVIAQDVGFFTKDSDFDIKANVGNKQWGAVLQWATYGGLPRDSITDSGSGTRNNWLKIDTAGLGASAYLVHWYGKIAIDADEGRFIKLRLQTRRLAKGATNPTNWTTIAESESCEDQDGKNGMALVCDIDMESTVGTSKLETYREFKIDVYRQGSDTAFGNTSIVMNGFKIDVQK